MNHQGTKTPSSAPREPSEFLDRVATEIVDAGFRIDVIVEDAIIIELKAVDSLLPVHLAQVLTYLKLGEYRLGFLMNFNVTRIKDGIRRVVL